MIKDKYTFDEQDRLVRKTNKGEIRDTSLLAYQNLKESGKLGNQEAVVYNCILINPNITDKEISIKTKININAVTGRRNGLVKKKLVTDNGKRNCKITGSLVYQWKTYEQI